MRWRYGILIGLFFALLAIYPQVRFVQTRGPEYNGAAFLFDHDEPAYAAYLQAKIDRRPESIGIYSGQYDEENSILSAQALPASLIAPLARTMGLSADRIFFLLSIFTAFATALAVYWFLSKIFHDPLVAALGTFFILVSGNLFAGAGVIRDLLGLGISSPSAPYLRRFSPALAFPFFFLLCGSVWIGLNTVSRNLKWILVPITAGCFGVLVYSYFYLWTAAAAWIGLILVMSLMFLRTDRRLAVKNLWFPIVAICLVVATPYLYSLYANFDVSSHSLALEHTHYPVWNKLSSWAGIVLLALNIVLIKLGKLQLDSPSTLLSLTFALLPVVLLNQQVVSGITLQPFHYNVYVANYSVAMGAVLMVASAFGKVVNRIHPFVVAAIVLIFVCWSAVETEFAFRYRLAYNIRRDETIPVAIALRNIAGSDVNALHQVTFNADLLQADFQPVFAPQGVLWADHMRYVTSLTGAEIRDRYFLHLYFAGKDLDHVRAQLKQCPRSEVCNEFFGWRTNPSLTARPHLPELNEIEHAVEEYERFLAQAESGAVIQKLQISYAIVRSDTGFNLTPLDRWYERSEVGIFDKYILYKLIPKDVQYAINRAL